MFLYPEIENITKIMVGYKVTLNIVLAFSSLSHANHEYILLLKLYDYS